MIAATPSTLLMAQADSARAVVAVYTVSVLATLPLVLAAVVTFALRHANAGARVLVWRSAIIALLLAVVGRLPMHSLAWAVPSALAAPLVVLGRVQVTAASLTGGQDAGGFVSSIAFVRLLLAIYLTGVAIVSVPTFVASVRMRRIARRACRVNDDAWPLDDVRNTLGIARPVRLLISADVVTPMTWGLLRPVVVLPSSSIEWNRSERTMVLLHELAHVRAADWAFNLAGRAACALYWFHPGAWWVARGLRADCELACDDRVIAAGVRRSDYAELLVSAAAALRAPLTSASVALALSQRAGLRARLAAVLDTRHDVRPLARGWALVAMFATLSVAGPMSAVRLAPSRDVLTALMTDARWESRAYAVLGLAQRQDSVAAAQSAAELDPSPRVRAWARYALGQRTSPFDVRTLLHN